MAIAQKWKSADFSLPLSAIVSAPQHIWVTSGYSNVKPTLHTVCGVKDFFSPPLSTSGFDMKMRFEGDGFVINDNGEFWGQSSIYTQGTWYPDAIVRNGTYHRYVSGNLVSLGFQSTLVPLYGRSGFILKTIVTNRGSSPLRLKATPVIDPGILQYTPLDKWGFSPPNTKPETRKTGEGTWSSEKVSLQLLQNDSGFHQLAASGSTTFYTVLLLSHVDEPAVHAVDFESLIHTSSSAWQRRLDKHLASVPQLKSNVEGLDNYYRRSLISGLVCVWEKPEFIINPHIATAGMDGGGLNTYLWDAGYVSRMLTLMFGEHAETLARQLAKVRLDSFYSYTVSGKGTGVSYSYSTWAFMNMVWQLAQQRGFNRTLFDEAKRLVLAQEALPTRNGLIDFGKQHNLLEMRNAGYEHYVASPNAERAVNLQRLAALNDMSGGSREESAAWREKATDIIAAVRKELWDEKAGWFASVYPDGRREMVYSIQMFDVIHAGATTPPMTERMLQHLVQGKFLFPYGISSVSKEDSLRYEYNDTDWGGSGAYTGDGPQLASILYHLNKPALAYEVLQSYFWMGKHLAYSPRSSMRINQAVLPINGVISSPV
jgi:hypothetical protein